jgi:hypothetical protein
MVEAIGGAILGAVLSLILPWLVTYCRHFRRFSISGEWFAEWQPVFGESDRWISEKVRVRHGLGDIVIRSAERGLRYDWIAHLTVVDRAFLVGRWRSTRQGSHSGGLLVLAVSSSAIYMYGYLFAPHSAGARTLISHIVLSSDPAYLKLAREALDRRRRSLGRREVWQNQRLRIQRDMATEAFDPSHRR